MTYAKPGQLPPAHGLYDPQFEHDACGVGFVANIKGHKSHAIIQQGLDVLRKLEHRGATGSDPDTGDGAGILLQIPHQFFVEELAAQGVTLPAPGHYGIGMLFLPPDTHERELYEAAFEQAVTDEGQTVLAWRDVPCDSARIGALARTVEPIIRQIFISRSPDLADDDAFERKLYIIRRVGQNAIAKMEMAQEGYFYVNSLSCRTIVYKGLLMTHQMDAYYHDLSDPRATTAIALVHQRFSTNTFPTWDLAHPFRYIAHNGEINTLRGNRNWMSAREKTLQSALFGDDIKKLLPLVNKSGSDSAALDNAVELLTLGGRSLPHAMMMLMPEAWTGDPLMDDDRRAFYEYHACLMEPWDGPAAVCFTDGRVMGALLDRNGLRPARYIVTDDDLVVLASEAGVMTIDPARVRHKGRLQPGRMFLIDLEQGRIVPDDEIKGELCRAHPYKEWLDANRITLANLPEPPFVHLPDHHTLLTRQKTFGYTLEDLRLILFPMATNGEQPLGSMGTDTPLAILSRRPQLLYNYFKQLFAQVTNPPVDPIREELVMSLVDFIGSDGNLLDATPQHAHMLKLESPILTNYDLEKLRNVRTGDFNAQTLPLWFDVEDGPDALAQAVDRLCQAASRAVASGYSFLVLSDRDTNAFTAPIPSLLATSAIHHHLVREGTRTRVGIIVESGEAREVMHFALLIGYGASAINPYLAFETLDNMAREKLFPPDITVEKASYNFIKAVNKGLLKTFAKMGISTLQSYRGAQIFEAIGLDRDMVARYFTGTPSRLGGVALDVIQREALSRHAFAYPKADVKGSLDLDPGGQYQWRRFGEQHAYNPDSISRLQTSVRREQVVEIGEAHSVGAPLAAPSSTAAPSSKPSTPVGGMAANGNGRHTDLETQRAGYEKGYASFKEFSKTVNQTGEAAVTLRSLLHFKPGTPIPLDDVEPASEIVKRFVTGAMSLGSISRESHETLAIAMNRIGGKSNTGEGGEDSTRYTPDANGDSRRSAIKQIASARFGVTAHYLVNADELQIKMAQGAKPGEGGELPGTKIDKYIAGVRHTTPGVTLISPPPHHDIYSIEDLAQLIFDLKNVNPAARISVKLVAEIGVGTVAAGVSKAHADHILISGYDGGTGASPVSSIKHAGIPWEMGLAETQQTLVKNDLRGRVTVQTDGQLKTGRDVAVAVLLGAEEFGFSSAPLIAMGCIMMRVCHLGTCPVGIATQDPVLRGRFTGQPEHVVNYFFFVAEELREIMAELGFRTVNEMVGRIDMLDSHRAIEHWKMAGLDLTPILTAPEGSVAHARLCVSKQEHGLDDALDYHLIALSQGAVDHGIPVAVELPIYNKNRTVGTMLSGRIALKYGGEGLPDDTIRLKFFGSSGQSFGAFLARGITMTLEGDANDYLGKGLSGGRIIVYPPRASLFDPAENIIAGNTLLYGATSGEVYLRGIAGERFGVRNSGATAVVEGTGDHGCEYMTGGTVVVLGGVGRNFAAGMSGGTAYVWDPEGRFPARCNRNGGKTEIEAVVESADADMLRDLIAKHVHYTRSDRGAFLLQNWETTRGQFVKVVSLEYRKVQQELEAERTGGKEDVYDVMPAGVP